MQPDFHTKIQHILDRINRVDPVEYGRSRNFIDGAVTYLSPYISRGVISTKQVLATVLDKGYSPWKIEKFIQELAWRDYWQLIWFEKGEAINDDLNYTQSMVSHFEMPSALMSAKTGIHAIDDAINQFYKTGYLHNHVRMYIAAIACNMGKSHWKVPAQWMYYHLLDADWASNALSWQWVAGTTRARKYVANQQNINKYCKTSQRGTFLDVPYEAFNNFETPEELRLTEMPNLKANLPKSKPISFNADLPVCLYNFYQMDPSWKKELNANRILLLEPDHFAKYPVSTNSIEFLLALASNIKGLQVFVGSFESFIETFEPKHIYYKEHPLNRHYRGIQESRDWMFSVRGSYSSFFAFWKRCKKEL
jgi:deoxyribodipyrimidine photo-lyase